MQMLSDDEVECWSSVTSFCCLRYQSIHGKRTLLPSGSKTCEDCNQMQRQITEFQKQLLTTKAERDEAIKRKEEVNAYQSLFFLYFPSSSSNDMPLSTFHTYIGLR